MQAVGRWIRLVILTLLVCRGPWPVQAASARPAKMGSALAGAQTPIYLPLVSKGYRLFNEAVSVIEPAARSGIFDQPFDATPDPDATTLYFTATSAQGAGVFSVPADGGTVVTLTVGAPFSLPLGLAINPSGQTLYVADPQTMVPATRTGQSDGQGALFSLPVTGGAAMMVAGTAGTAPRGLDVVQENSTDLLYFTGLDPSDGQPAVMKIAADGGPLSIIAKGDPLVDPVGIAVGTDGTLYVTDQAAAGGGLGRVFQIKGGAVETIADNVRTGTPAGVALTLDESLLLVSALDANRDSSLVFVIDLATLQASIVNKVIEVNIGSGGLHRAHNRTTMAWCGVTTGNQGTVYRIGF